MKINKKCLNKKNNKYKNYNIKYQNIKNPLINQNKLFYIYKNNQIKQIVFIFHRLQLKKIYTEKHVMN